MNSTPIMEAFWHNAALLAASLLPLSPTNVLVLQAKQYGDFDRYVLAPSWQTGFYQSQHDRNRNERDGCRLQIGTTSKAGLPTIYGLWPGLPKSVTVRGVDERRQMHSGCATCLVPNLPEVHASRVCSSPGTELPLETAARLSETIPGAGRRSYLERYKYAEYGVYFGFDPDAYLGTMIHLNQETKESGVGKFLMDNYDKTMSRRDFDTAFAKNWGKENVKAVKLTYQDNPVYSVEIWISVRADTINAPFSANSFLPQPCSGSCGETFVIDKTDY